jgi:hypothetical protein
MMSNAKLAGAAFAFIDGAFGCVLSRVCASCKLDMQHMKRTSARMMLLSCANSQCNCSGVCEQRGNVNGACDKVVVCESVWIVRVCCTHLSFKGRSLWCLAFGLSPPVLRACAACSCACACSPSDV